MRIKIEVYYETEWVARGQGIYVTGSSLLDLRDRLALCLDKKKIPAPREVAVALDRQRIPSWVTRHLALQKEILWKL